MRTDDARSSFWWYGNDRDTPPASREWRPIGAGNFTEPDEKLAHPHPWFTGSPGAWADDLLRVARAAFVADKLADREASPDGWTRHLRLSVPVADPDAWRGAAGGLLERLLQTLTADVWDAEFRQLGPRHIPEPLPPGPGWEAAEVALFSGGLDSLSWAAQRATEGEQRLLFVMFTEGKLKQVQQRVRCTVQRLAERHGRQMRLLETSQNVRGDENHGSVAELSSRPRGLLYATTAIRAAAADGVPVVHIPENGQLALNPPLSPSRSAALSTRSVHPWTLHLLNELIAAIGGDVRVRNPLVSFTKGEVCRRARQAGLSAEDLEATLSCGGSPVRRSSNRPFANCGTCFPCLVRRSGLLRANGRDATGYEKNPWDLPTTGRRSARDVHWLALRRWLDGTQPYSALDLIADQPLPPDARPADWIRTIEDGREELRGLVQWAERQARSA